MSNHYSEHFARIEKSCGSLLCDLQKIRDEIGEVDDGWDTTLFEVEQECLQVYMKRIEEVKEYRTKLQRDIATAMAELSDIFTSMGENSVRYDLKPGGNLTEEFETLIPLLEDMRRKKVERINQFVGVVGQIQKLSNEILGVKEQNGNNVFVDETNLSLKRLEELHSELRELQNEKINRLNQVQDRLYTINSLCTVLGMDFKQTVCRIHPSLDDLNGVKDASNSTIARLAAQIQSLQELKIKRTQRSIQDLASALLELWYLMDTPVEEQKMFLNVTCKIAASEPEFTQPNMLSLDSVKKVEEEVSRLQLLKTGKMKDIVLKKKVELEDMCRRTHIVMEALISTDYSIEAMESGAIDLLYLLEQIDLQISKVKEEAVSRKEILERVDKWLAAREEESWLEEYNRNDNRYNAGRRAHLILKRAEKARTAVNKIPGTTSYYAGGLQQPKPRKRNTEAETEKPKETSRAADDRAGITRKKASRPPTTAVSHRKLSFGGAMLQQVNPEKPASHLHPNKKADYMNENSFTNHQRSSGFITHSGRRSSEIPGRVVKKQPSSAAKTRVVRKPLSSVSFAANNNVNVVNPTEDQKKVQSEQGSSTGCKTPMAKASKTTSNEDEKGTPKTMPIPIPKTPSTVSAPMLIATTPATPAALGAYKFEKILEQVQHTEYSFEEVRAEFLLS